MGHPGHVHFFRHLIAELESKGHECLVCVKERENTTKLLDLFDITYSIFGKTYPNRPAKAWGVMANDIRLINIARRFKPDLTLSIGGLYSVHAGACLGVPSIDFTDTENARFTNMLTFPFATVVATPDCYRAPVPAHKHRPYPGYHELAYLHPDRFEPDPSIIEDLGLEIGEYIVVRLSSLDASHQEGEGALSEEEKVQLILGLSEYKKVIVDSESPLPSKLDRFRMNIPEHLYHHLLAHAALYVGEGATAASESGVLGVPWVYASRVGRCYLDDQENRYGLGKTVSSLEKALRCADVMLKKDITEGWQRLLKDKIDVTSWMIKLIEDFL